MSHLELHLHDVNDTIYKVIYHQVFNVKDIAHSNYINQK